MSPDTKPPSLFAAVHVSEFPAQSILRLRPDLQSAPVVILDGTPPQERVIALNSHARKRGIIQGLTRLEVEEVGSIHILTRSAETEIAARTVLLETLSQFSPRIEEVFANNACSFVLDIAGSERLFGAPDQIAHRLRETIVAAGFRASVSISDNFHTARIKSEFSRGISIIPSGRESNALASIPISALPLDLDHYGTFALWGIGTLGELAALPEDEMIPRFGQPSRQWLALARGNADHTFQPLEEKFELKEHIEFETHIEQLDALLFIGANMIANLVARATCRALSLASINIEMQLERSPAYKRRIQPAIPSCDRKFLLKLLQLELAAHPPQAAVTALTLIADAGRQSKIQLGLFAPQAPEPSRLDVTLARLKAMVGADRVGSPALLDSHAPGRFQMQEFSVIDQPRPSAQPSSPRTSLRRIRPPHPLSLQITEGKPRSFRDGATRYEISVAYGPWQSSGSWWDLDRWDLEEWDVMATTNSGESISCLLIHDHLNNKWLLDAYYD
ncbi:DNA polymerase Y family protein [Occallatibacter savannae]|uniref:DNA polymerase Y family protein n=1 Tax=Occallatibacter savannae TaxID=1002691 RepID=UPI0013A57A06|nr:DNA polymerase Y family protein [Occallatibacter savannae]